jgi:hypothetical protein
MFAVFSLSLQDASEVRTATVLGIAKDSSGSRLVLYQLNGLATAVCSGPTANLDFKAHPQTRQLVDPATSRRGSALTMRRTRLRKRADGRAADET